MGRGAEDPVRLLKLCLLQFLHDLSDQDVIAQTQVNVAFRFFLNLSLESRAPSPALLSQFRTRLGAERFRSVFNHVLAQARARHLVSDRLRLKDATHLLAAVAIPTTLMLVAQARERLLTAAAAFEPEAVAAHRAEAERVRETSRGLLDAQRLVARVDHLRQIVGRAAALAREVREQARGGERERTRLEQALVVAHKVLSDRGEEAGGDKLRSVVDADVRRSKHGQWYDGYALDVLVDADSELVTAVEVVAANADEAANAVDLIEGEEAAQGNDIEAVSIDAVGFRGDVLERLMDEESGPRLQVFVPPFDRSPAPEGRFGSEAFEVEASTGVLRCPAGQQTSRFTEATRQGRRYHFTAAQCRGCRLREGCVGAGGRKPGRYVFKSDYEAQYRRARQVAESAAYREARRQQPRVERKLGEIVRHHAGRRVRYRGLARVRVQYYLTAVVVNLKRMVKLLASAALCAEPA
jgi:hypothetical protein